MIALAVWGAYTATITAVIVYRGAAVGIFAAVCLAVVWVLADRLGTWRPERDR